MADDGGLEVHDVAVMAGVHELDDVHRAGGADALEVVAAEVDEHDVLGALLGSSRRLLLERQIVLGTLATRAGAGDRVQDHLAAGDLDMHLRRGADDVQRAAGRMLGAGRNIGAGVGRAQHAVDIERIGRTGDVEALADDDLEGFAGPDVFLARSTMSSKAFGVILVVTSARAAAARVGSRVETVDVRGPRGRLSSHRAASSASRHAHSTRASVLS